VAWIAVGVVEYSSNEEELSKGSLYSAILRSRPSKKHKWMAAVRAQSGDLFLIEVRWLIFEEVKARLVNDERIYEKIVKPRVMALFEEAREILKREEEEQRALEEWLSKQKSILDFVKPVGA